MPENGDKMNISETEIMGRKPPLIPNINVTPLIDVLLVLLIIFMVIQPRKEAQFESQIPQKPAYEKPAPVPADLLVIEIKSGYGLDQIIELNSTPMSLIDLASRLGGVLNQRGDKTVILKAPKDQPYGDVIQVIDAIKGAGAAPIGLQIDYLL